MDFNPFRRLSRPYFLWVCVVIFPYQAYAQDIDIREVKLAGSKVEIHYDLSDERPDRTYAISLYTSKDNYIQPMEMVHGDIGIDIKVGDNKVITWEAMEELGSDFDGEINLELKGNIYVPFITVDGLPEGTEFTRGKPFEMVWSGGRGSNLLNFELYRGEQLIFAYDELGNTGNAEMTIPGNIKPGEDYRFRISDTRNRDDVVITNYFIVKPKIPKIVKIVAGAAVILGPTIYFVTREQEEALPLPPPQN